MRSLLILVLLGASAPGCCCTWDGPWAAGGHPALSGPGSAAYRAAYTPGYRRPCYPAYRPIDSASLP
jgi:hypothetical protein